MHASRYLVAVLGLRFLATENVFLDGGVLFPVTEDALTAALVAAVTIHN